MGRLIKEIRRNLKIAKENNDDELIVYIKNIHRIHVILKYLSKLIKYEEDCNLNSYFHSIFYITKNLFYDYFTKDCENHQTLINADRFYDYLKDIYGYQFYGFSTIDNVSYLEILNNHNDYEDVSIPFPFTKDEQWYENLRKKNVSSLITMFVTRLNFQLV